MQCPFCQVTLAHSIDGEDDQERCANPECQFHKMPRYFRCLTDGIVVTEIIVLPPDIYLVIDHLRHTTVIWKLDVVAISDPIYLPQVLPLDLINVHETWQRIKLLTTFS